MAFVGESGPTYGVDLDKIAVLWIRDEGGVYTGVDAFTVGDCMNSDTDDDGRPNGKEGDEVHEFEADDLALAGPNITGINGA